MREQRIREDFVSVERNQSLYVHHILLHNIGVHTIKEI